MIVMIVEVNRITHERNDVFGVELGLRVFNHLIPFLIISWSGIGFEGRRGFDSNEEEVVPKVDDVSLVDGVFDGAFGRYGEEDIVMGRRYGSDIFITRDVDKELSRWNDG
ncbi:hypothetical protein Tco_0378621 [Tanacetum coccineum]